MEYAPPAQVYGSEEWRLGGCERRGRWCRILEHTPRLGDGTICPANNHVHS